MLKMSKVVETVKNLKWFNVFTIFAADSEQPSEEAEENSDPAKKSEEAYINFENLMARARKEEKDKLYPKIASLETEVKVLTKRNNDLLIAAESAKAEVEDIKKKLALSGKDDSEQVAKLKTDLAELQTKYEALEKNSPKAEDIEAKIRAEYEVKLYREEKLREVGNTIIPELVTGATKEEIDASVELSKKRFEEIFSSTFSGIRTPNPANRTPLPAAPTGAGIVNKSINAEDVRKMTPEQYREFRKTLGLK